VTAMLGWFSWCCFLGMYDFDGEEITAPGHCDKVGIHENCV